VDEPVDAIPLKKSNPLLIGGIIGAVVLVGAVVVLTGGKKKGPATQEGAAAQPVNTDTMTPEERKRHIEITRKGLEAWGEQQKAEEEKKKAAEAAKEEKEKEEKEKAAAVAAGGPAPAGGGDPPPKKTNTAAAKKQADSLEGMASDITGKLKK
jgi:hypothetical protein